MAKSKLKQKLCQNLINSKLVKVGDVIEHSYTDGGERDLKRLIVSNDGICPTMTTRIDCLGVVWRTNKMETKRYKNYITWKNKQGEFNTECNRASLPDTLALTLATGNVGKVIDNARERERESNLRIRKLTPCECIKLMGFERKDYQAMRDIGMSDMAIWHVAGDSIVVPVLMGIFAEYLGVNDYEQRIEQYVDKLTKE